MNVNSIYSRINTCKIYYNIDFNFILGGIKQGSRNEIIKFNSLWYIYNEIHFFKLLSTNSLRTYEIFDVFLSNQKVRVTLKL